MNLKQWLKTKYRQWVVNQYKLTSEWVIDYGYFELLNFARTGEDFLSLLEVAETARIKYPNDPIIEKFESELLFSEKHNDLINNTMD